MNASGSAWPNLAQPNQAPPNQTRPSVAIVSHVLNDAIRAGFERLMREAPADHEVRFILSSDDPHATLGGLPEDQVDRISRADVLALRYPEKCQDADWNMAGNLDLVFLEFQRRHPGHDQYWFLEYDVHWEGEWSVLFEHFRTGGADVLGATMLQMDDVPHKEGNPSYPRQVVPPGMAWARQHVLRGFLPACRISERALLALDAAYRAGLGGHYEVNVPTVAAQNGMVIEDFGGRGRFVRPENRDRFYFARGDNYSHSPGSFVFRPMQRVLARPNTLWHPVKPDGVPVWHPLRVDGGPAKTALEWVKPLLWQLIIRLWFAARWRPLPGRTPARGGESTSEIRSLTGLRGAAACLVMMYHFTAGGAGFGPLAPLVLRGYQAVDLFFVLSGYVMALTYGRRPRTGGGAAYLLFLGRRLGRVYPLYLAATLFRLAVATPGWDGMAVLANLGMVQAWGLADSIGGPTWSISTEFAAYVAFPALLLLTAARGSAAATAAVCLAVLAVVAGQDAAVLHQVQAGEALRRGALDVFGAGTPFPLLRCIAGFTLGLAAFRLAQAPVLARWMAKPLAGDVAALAVVALMLLPGTDVLLVAAFVPLVATLAAGRSRIARVLGRPVMHWLGTVSYSIYLVHRPVEDLLRPALTSALQALRVPHAFSAAAALMVPPVLLMSALTYRLIEQPCRIWSHRLLGQAGWRRREQPWGDGPAWPRRP